MPSLGVPLQCRAEEVDMVDQEEEVMGVVPAATAAKGEGAMEEVVVKVARPLTEAASLGVMGAAVRAAEAALGLIEMASEAGWRRADKKNWPSEWSGRTDAAEDRSGAKT